MFKDKTTRRLYFLCFALTALLAGQAAADAKGLPLPVSLTVMEEEEPAGVYKVSINRATARELEQLPGVGPVTAQSIIAYREQNGGFSQLEELLDIRGIGQHTYQGILPMITL